MKLLKSAVLGIILALPMFVFSGSAQAVNTAWPISSELYQFPGQNDSDWKIVFNLYTNYTPNPSNFRIYILSNYGGYLADMTQDDINQPPGKYECKSQFVSSVYMGWGYQVTYMLGKTRASGCFGQWTVDTWEVYMTY